MSLSHPRATPSNLRKWIVRLSAISVIIGTLLLLLAEPHNSLHIIRPRHLNPSSVLRLYDLRWTRQYVSTFFTELRSTKPCAPGFLFFVPDGQSPTIVDQKGELIWQERPGTVTENFRVQTFRGEPYLTYWAEGPLGHGSYYMLDSTYSVRYTVSSVEMGFDFLHDFTITYRDTALVSAHYKRRADLSSMGGPPDGWILDAMFQEIDIATGNLLYEWRASEHLPVTTSMRDLEDGEGVEARPFDYFRINSVNQNPSGDFLISAGHLHAVICIDGSTGQVKWNLGGRHNSFRDGSERPDVELSWPQNALSIGSETLIVMDGGEKETDSSTPNNRGLEIHVNAQTGRAAVRQIYSGPKGPQIYFSGDLRISRDTKSLFVSWGGGIGFSEYSADGEILCNNRFPDNVLTPALSETSVPFPIFKSSWTGRPSAMPVARRSGHGLLVHWNGATEVTEWQLQVRTIHAIREPDTPHYQHVGRYTKTGFETLLDIPPFQGNSHHFRVAALDRQGVVIGYTKTVEWQQAWTGSELSQLQLIILAGVCLFGGLLTIVSTLHICSKNQDREVSLLPSYEAYNRRNGRGIRDPPS